MNLPFVTRQSDLIQLEYDASGNAEDIAAERGQKVVYPRKNQLQIDCDDNLKRDTIIQNLALVFDRVDVQPYEVKVFPSKTAGHWHIYVFFYKKEFTEEERMLWQAALGDDPSRVFLNFLRLRQGDDHPSRLFEAPSFVNPFPSFTCACQCGYTCGRKCGLSITECIQQHYSQKCGHRFQSEMIDVEIMGGEASSTACLDCGLPSICHDMQFGP